MKDGLINFLGVACLYHIIRILFINNKFWFRQLSVYLVLFIISVPILLIPFYRGVEAYTWHRFQPGDVVAEINSEDINVYGKGIEQLTLFKLKAIREALVAKPNYDDPRYLPYSYFPNVIFVPEGKLASIIGGYNILKSLKKENTHTKAWVDYNTAKKLKSGIGDIVWVPHYKHVDKYQKPIRVDLEVQIYGLLRPYFSLLPNNSNEDGLVIIELDNITSEFFNNRELRPIYKSVEENVKDDKSYFYYMLLKEIPNNIINNDRFLNREEYLQAAVHKFGWDVSSENVKLWRDVLRPSLFIIFPLILLFAVMSRELKRYCHDIYYPASLLITLGASPNKVMTSIIIQQVFIFISSLALAIIIIKYALFQLLFDTFFSIGSFVLSLCILSIVFLFIIFKNKQLVSIFRANILNMR